MAGGLFRSLFDFHAESEKDLSLNRGDLVKVTKEINNEWFQGVNGYRSGQFPSTYVERIFDKATHRVGIAITTFSPQQDGDLALNDGDVVCITQEIDKNWLAGYTNKAKGIFPANHIKEIQFLDTHDLVNNNSLRTNKVQASTADTNHGGAIHERPYAEAIEDFVKQENDELTIKKGDTVYLLREIDSFWLEGSVNNKMGKFPRTFVKVVHDLPQELKYFEKNDESDNLSAEAKALCMFVGTKPEELSFGKGDVIILTERVNKDWLRGRIGNHTGIFPANCVEITVDLPYKENISEILHCVSATSSPVRTTIVATTVQSPRRHSFNKKRPPPPAHRPAQSRQASDNLPSTLVNKQSKSSILTCSSVPPLPVKGKESPLIPKPLPIKSGSFFYQNEDAVNSDTSSQNSSKDTTSEKPSLRKQISKSRTLTKADIQAIHRIEVNDNKLENDSSLSRSDSIPSRPVPPATQNCLKKPIAPARPNSNAIRKETTTDKLIPSTTKQDLLSSSPLKTNNVNLPKPLAPTPHLPNQIRNRPTSLNLPLTHKDIRSTEDVSLDQPQIQTKSGVSISKSKELSVRFSKEKNSVFLNDLDNISRGMSRSETDPDILKACDTSLKLPLTPSLNSNRLDTAAPSIFFSTSSKSSTLSSPEKRHQTLDAMLQRSVSSSVNKIGENGYKTSGTSTSLKGSTDSLSSQSQELKRIDTAISEIKSNIDGEVHLLSGVETLLDFVSDDKRTHLLAKQERHNGNIVELNAELNALEDEKSFLLASLGKVDDVKNRVTELERQIETYLDNCENLRRMQDVSVVEDLPEIRDNIEFCENMVDTLQDELNGLRGKLNEMGELDQIDSVPDSVERTEKRQKNQKKVIEELINTEKSYVKSITLLSYVMKELEENQVCSINISGLFSNLPKILNLSTRLLENLQLAHSDEDLNEDEIPGNIASCFIGLTCEMKELYSTYCHTYEEAQCLLEKYGMDETVWSAITSTIEKVCGEHSTDAFDLSSYLIKPVQRVLKYPLLLSELLKNHEEDGVNREVIKYALTTVTDVATAINEFKRRQDLVQKYRETEDGITKKVQKLNWHSVAKKSSRINQRITQFTGINSQTVDEGFIEEEKRFRGLEKLIKSLLKNIDLFAEDFKSNVSLACQVAESVYKFHEEGKASEEVKIYYTTMTIITQQYAQEMESFISEHVKDPLKELLQLFHGPFRLIQKRNDKCLDYDRAKNRASRAKDSKEKEKIAQTHEELQLAQNVFMAMNTQLLEELPTLYTKSSKFLKYCLANFAEAHKRYLSKSFSLLHQLWERPNFLKNVDMFERHTDLIQKAIVQLSQLSFIPSNLNKETPRRSQTQVINTAILNASLFVGVSSSTNESQSKPLIDISNDALDTVDKANTTLDLSQENSFQNIESMFDDISSSDLQYVVTYTFEAESDAEITVSEGAIVNVVRKFDKNGNSEWWLVECEGRKGYMPESFLVKYDKPATRPYTNKKSFDEHLIPSSTETFILQPIVTSKKPPVHVATNQNSLSTFYLDDSIENNHMMTSNSTFYVDEMSNNTEQLADMTNIHFPRDNKNRETEKSKSDASKPKHIVEYDFEALNSGELSVKEGQLVDVLRKRDQKGNEEWWFVEYDGQQGYVPRDFITTVTSTEMC